jgi:carboxyl-terminal processing protease
MRMRRFLQTALLSVSLLGLYGVQAVHAQDGDDKKPATSAPAGSPDNNANGGSDAAAAVPAGDPANTSETYNELNLFGDVFERVRAQYVDPVTDKKMIEYAINGMLTSLDPHSSYMDENEFKEMQVTTRGEFGGLGIEVTMENGLVKVVSPIDDTPAYRGGVKAGDYIVEIDGKPVIGMTLNDAVDEMRGKIGTPIKLMLRREGVPEPIEVTLVRDVIKIQSVKHDTLTGDIGYIRITTFSENTDSGLRDAVAKIKAQLGNKLLGYIIDLRNNPGGLLDQAIAVSDDFLNSGEIVSTRGRHADDDKVDNATPGDIADGLPIVVLINGGSASASEIVSGALQDHRRALLLGTQSFGKGSVQTVIPLPGHGAMRLTTARYFTPSGRSIQAKGITPDIVVEPAKVEALAVERIRESDLKGALANPDGKDADAIPAKLLPGNKPADKDAKPDSKTITEPGDTDDDNAPDVNENDTDKSTGKDKNGKSVKADKLSNDYQLARAVDVLTGISLYNQRHNGKTPADTHIPPTAGGADASDPDATKPGEPAAPDASKPVKSPAHAKSKSGKPVKQDDTPDNDNAPSDSPNQ